MSHVTPTIGMSTFIINCLTRLFHVIVTDSISLRNAIRVDNLAGEKVGHIKATMAKSLAAIMDNGNARLEGTIPRKGNTYNLPLVLDFYSNNAISGEAGAAAAAAENLRAELRRRGDYNFGLSSELGGPPKSAKKSATVEVVRKKMDWNHQQAALDKMFDKQLKDQYKDLPDITMPNCLVGITLMPYQVQGIKWLIKKENNSSPAPFYKKVKEKGKTMHLCEITNSSQVTLPLPVRGSILCDEMGLGEFLHTFHCCDLVLVISLTHKILSQAKASKQSD